MTHGKIPFEAGFVELVDAMPNHDTPPDHLDSGDQRIVEAARVSVAGEGVTVARQDKGLIDYLVRNRHTSPLEQVVFTYRIKLPIFVARQMVRHRTSRINEMSGRYSVMPDEYWLPSQDRLERSGQSAKNKQATGEPLDIDTAVDVRERMNDMLDLSFQFYQELLNRGVGREVARSVLPLATMTQWYFQIDLHNLMHFLGLRLDQHAQEEIRHYAKAMLVLAYPFASVAFDSWMKHHVNLDQCPELGHNTIESVRMDIEMSRRGLTV